MNVRRDAGELQGRCGRRAHPRPQGSGASFDERGIIFWTATVTPAIKQRGRRADNHLALSRSPTCS